MPGRPGSVGLVGLGLMGSGLAARLLGAGYTVHGFDVDRGAAEAHRTRGGTVEGSAAELAGRCGVVVLSLPNDEIAREACLGPAGVREGAGPGTLVVQTGTGGPESVLELAGAFAASGVTVVDVGLSGSSRMAARGELIGMVGGDRADYERTEPVLRAFCREVFHVGPRGHGMRAKLLVNHVHTLNRFALAEGLVFAEKMGLDLDLSLTLLRAGSAYSRQMDIRGERMVEGDHETPTARIRGDHKDMRLILDEGAEVGAPMPAMAVVGQLLQAAMETGLSEADGSSIVEVLRRLAGIGRVPGP